MSLLIDQYTSGEVLVSLWAEHRARRKGGRESTWLADRSNAPTPVPTERMGDPLKEQRYLDLKVPIIWEFDPDEAHVAYIRVEQAIQQVSADAKHSEALSKCAYAVHTDQFTAKNMPNTVVWREVWELLDRVPDLRMEQLYKAVETINKLRFVAQEVAS